VPASAWALGNPGRARSRRGVSARKRRKRKGPHLVLRDEGHAGGVIILLVAVTKPVGAESLLLLRLRLLELRHLLEVMHLLLRLVLRLVLRLRRLWLRLRLRLLRLRPGWRSASIGAHDAGR